MSKQKQNFNLGDYVDVQTRVRMFYEKFPDGRLTSGIPWVERVEYFTPRGETVVRVYAVQQAFAHRGPDDQHPGVGTAAELIPGATPYTDKSEFQNLETSAWGRAIYATGILNTKIASREEVERMRDSGGYDGSDEGRSDDQPSSAILGMTDDQETALYLLADSLPSKYNWGKNASGKYIKIDAMLNGRVAARRHDPSLSSPFDWVFDQLVEAHAKEHGADCEHLQTAQGLVASASAADLALAEEPGLQL